MRNILVDFHHTLGIFLVSICYAGSYLWLSSQPTSEIWAAGQGICIGIGKQAKGCDSIDHNSMKIPGREFHYHVRSHLVLSQDVFYFCYTCSCSS